jgi:hypothetical protein
LNIPLSRRAVDIKHTRSYLACAAFFVSIR